METQLVPDTFDPNNSGYLPYRVPELASLIAAEISVAVNVTAALVEVLGQVMSLILARASSLAEPCSGMGSA